MQWGAHAMGGTVPPLLHVAAAQRTRHGEDAVRRAAVAAVRAEQEQVQPHFW